MRLCPTRLSLRDSHPPHEGEGEFDANPLPAHLSPRQTAGRSRCFAKASQRLRSGASAKERGKSGLNCEEAAGNARPG